MNGILKDSVKQQGETIKHMRTIIIGLIIAWTISICVGFAGFVWYESQFVQLDGDEQTTEVYTEGDNANASYINGNQYNENSTHNEGDK